MLRYSNNQSIENSLPYIITMLLGVLTIFISLVLLLIITKKSEKQEYDMLKKNDDYIITRNYEISNDVNHISIMVSYI